MSLQSGDIAKHLNFVSDKVRSQLDSLKRKEVERLNALKKLMAFKEEEADVARKAADAVGGSIKFKPAIDISRRVAESLRKLHGKTQLLHSIFMFNLLCFCRSNQLPFVFRTGHCLSALEK